jgi:hypothetical protein
MPLPESLRSHWGADNNVFRFGVNPVRKKLRHDVITGIISLLRTRYELAEKVYYHHAKCAADAMLDRLVRAAFATLPTTEDLVTLGDDEFLGRMRSSAVARQDANLSRLVADFDSRHLYKEVFRVSSARPLTPKAELLTSQSAKPAGRNEIEQRLLEDLPGLGALDLIVSSRPRKMQMKQARALVCWVDGQCYPLEEIATRYGYAREVTELTQRYRELWSCSVYLNPRRFQYARRVIERCQSDEFFGMSNDDSLQRTLLSDPRIPTAIHQQTDAVRNEVLDQAFNILAARGGAPEIDTLYRQVLDGRQEKRAPKPIAKPKRKEKADHTPQLDLTNGDADGEHDGDSEEPNTKEP